jgi:hypothetical protein
VDLYCVCSEERCYCVNLVHVDDPEVLEAVAAMRDYEIACPECAAGHHVRTLGGPRDTGRVH